MSMSISSDSLLNDENWAKHLDEQTVLMLETELDHLIRKRQETDGQVPEQNPEERVLREKQLNDYACALIRKSELRGRLILKCIMCGPSCQANAAYRLETGQLVVNGDNAWFDKDWPEIMTLFSTQELKKATEMCTGRNKELAQNILQNRS
jgi:hypothetical protein